MEADSPNPRDVLNAARSAASQGDFETALAKYEYFFDHALDDDTGAYYGVRLSYCLDEWSRIGRKFEPAHAALVNRKIDSLQLFEETGDPERFHDFVAICEYLKCTDEIVSEFARIDATDSELAGRLYLFARKILVRAKEWTLCGRQVEDGLAAYDFELAAFDQTWFIGKNDCSIGGAKYEDWLMRKYASDVSSLLLILKHCGRADEFNTILDRIPSDMQSRGQSELSDEIMSSLGK